MARNRARRRSRGLTRLAVLGALVGAAAAYRQRALARNTRSFRDRYDAGAADAGAPRAGAGIAT